MNSDFKNKLKAVGAFIKKIAVTVWNYIKVAKMELIVLAGVFALDMVSKSLVNAFIPHGDTFVVIPKFLQFTNSHNYAAAFGSDFIVKWFGSTGSRIFFSVFAVAAAVAFFLVLIKNKGKSKWFRVALALFIAGAMGNCIDRMFFNYVRDFIEIVYFGLEIFGRTSWYIFNIADAALVTSVIMLVIYFLFMYRDGADKKADAVIPIVSAAGEEDGLPAAIEGAEHGAVVTETVEQPEQLERQVKQPEQLEQLEQSEHSEQHEQSERSEISDGDKPDKSDTGGEDLGS